MSIKWLFFTSGQNVKPPFLHQYLVFFNNFVFIRDHISIIILIQKSKFEERCTVTLKGQSQLQPLICYGVLTVHAHVLMHAKKD